MGVITQMKLQKYSLLAPANTWVLKRNAMILYDRKIFDNISKITTTKAVISFIINLSLFLFQILKRWIHNLKISKEFGTVVARTSLAFE